MKRFVLLGVLCSVLGLGLAASGQTSSNASASTSGLPARATDAKPWQIGLFAGGAFEVDSRNADKFHFALTGVRFGKVLTHNVGNGWYRGNFEYAFDAIPVFPVFHGGDNQYGFGANPVVLKWNFTKPKKVMPYGEIAGGFVITQHDIPVTNSSSFNFVDQVGGGFHVFTSEKHSWNFGTKFFHLSNAGIGNRNPGIDGSLMFTVGYDWWK